MDIMKILLTTLVPLFAIFSNSTLDLSIGVDPLDAKNKSHMDLVAQTNFKVGPCSILIAPEVSFYLNKSVDFSMSIGHRWETLGGAVGHHVFADRSQLKGLSVNQVGTSVDFITNFLDFRVNYYHPLTGITSFKSDLLQPCKWMDSEVLLKLPICSLGTGPSYNFDTNTIGIQGRFIIPFERFSLGIGAIADSKGNKSTFFTTGFHLYKSDKKDKLSAPTSHIKRPRIYSLPPKEEPIIEVIEEVIEKVIEDEIDSLGNTPEEGKTYWEIFKGFFLG